MDAYLALLEAVAKPLLICVVTIGILLGLLALVGPRAFSVVVAKSNHWFDTRRFFRIPENRFFRIFDKWVDTDQHCVRHSRVTGAAVLLGAGLLGFLHFVR
ncbi:MAG: hypothetical protein ACYSWU_03585 [Planctomycetota bacterium]|jgi:hypothetical protein